MARFELLVRGGVAVMPEVTRAVDIGVRAGRIAMLAEPGEAAAGDSEIDATGCLVVPGGIDPHVHFSLRLSDSLYSQSTRSGSRAAAFGGTTTFIDFANQAGDQSLLEVISAKKAEVAREEPNVDYGLHAMLTGPIPFRVIEEMEDAVAEGISSFKMFTAFQEGSALGSLYMDDGRIWGVMQSASRLGATVMLHCEDDCIVDYHMRLLRRDGLVGGEHVSEARPPLAEEAAISRMLLLARRSGAALYVVHVSTADGVLAIAEARTRGQRVYGETLHNYLVFTADDYRRPDGLLFHNYPPLRSSADQEALWHALGGGSALDTVASDDVAVTMEAKLRGSRIDNLAGGHNGVETRMQVLFSEGVARRRLSIERFVQLTAANPARLFGLHPRKGAIAVGSDADLVLLDPEAHTQIKLSDLHSDADFSVWDGWRGQGRIRATIARGEVLVMDGEWVGPQGRGQFVPAATA